MRRWWHSGPVLKSCGSRLVDVYDVAMFDLDGVVYVGGEAVPGVADHISAVRALGMGVSFVTNNASRPPLRVSEHLTELGIGADPTDVVTSAQAAAHLLAEEHGAGAPIVALGGEGLVWALEEAGVKPVSVDDDAVAVATGYGPEVRWRDVMRVAVRVREGLRWVACNTDYTIPTPYGVAPGHGVLVETIQRFSRVVPTVAGKPARPLLDETIRRTGARRPVMIGDRLDTDIEGARNSGVDSLLVLTGVSQLAEVVAATVTERPTYLAPDLAGLFQPHPVPELIEDGCRLGGWTGRVVAGALQVAGSGSETDWWRVAATTAWGHADRVGSPPDLAGLVVPRTGAAGR